MTVMIPADTAMRAPFDAGGETLSRILFKIKYFTKNEING
jgi:hypothetical protein